MHSFNTVRRIVTGSGSTGDVASILGEASSAPVRNVLLVSDAHLHALGLLEPALQSFSTAGIAVTLYTDVVPDPPENCVLDCVEMARRERVDAVVAIGGGSSMDLAKVVAVLAHPDCGQPISGLYGVDQVQGNRLPLLLAPSTAGTGSEVTPIAIITTGETTKAGIVANQLYADAAILDPALTASLPPGICAVTAIDAMVHAIEAYTGRYKKNPLSDQLARGALALLADNIVEACAVDAPVLVRENMLVGAMQAGQAFANSPVAAIHALAYPLGGRFHLSHGLTNSLMMLPVMRYNLPVCASLYAQLARHLQLVPKTCADAAAADSLLNYVGELFETINIPLQLRNHGIAEDDLDMLAQDAMLQTRLLVNNPREVGLADALGLYREAW